MWALAAGQESAADLLIEKCGKDLVGCDGSGRTPLHLAAGSGQIHVLFTLLELEPGLATKPDKRGFTPVHYAAFHGQEGALELLLELSGALAQSKEESKLNPLHCAVVNNNEYCANILIANNKQMIKARTSLKETPLHIAAGNGSTAAVKILLKAGSDINAVDKKGRTPVMLATKFGHISCLEALLEGSPNLELVDQEGDTALHYSCTKGSAESADLVMKQVGDNADLVSKQNTEGKTALHLAAGKGMVDTTELLLTSGASVTLCDSAGNPPALDCARDEDTATCLALILSVYLANPSNETRKSLCSTVGRRSEIMSRLSTYFSDLDLDLSPRKQPSEVNGGKSMENGRHSSENGGRSYEKHRTSSENGSQSSQKAFKGSKIGRESSVNDHFCADSRNSSDSEYY